MSLEQAARLLAAGRHAEAERACRAVLATRPRDPAAQALLAEILLASGRAEAAWQAVEAALALDPGYAPAHAIAGALLLGAGRPADALAAFERAIPRLGHHPTVVYRHALALHRTGRDDAARQALEQAVRLAPNWPAPRIDLGHLAWRARRFDEAAAHYREALRLPGAPPDLARQLGEALRAAGRPAEALSTLRPRLAAAPTDGGSWRALARALDALAAPPGERVTAWGRAAQFAGSAQDHTAHGLALIEAGDYPAAHAAFARALAVDPGYLPAAWAGFQYPPEPMHADEAAVAAFRSAWDQGFERFERTLEAADPTLALAAVASVSNFYRHYVDEDLRDLQTRYAALLSRVVARTVPDPGAGARPRSGPRIRVALFSAHFFDHTILRLFGPMLSGLDPARFEVHAFAAGRQDEASRRFAAGLAGYTAGSHSVAGWAERIRSFAPDVLIYPDVGMDALSQCLATLRLAPVQAVLWGHPVTTGSTAIDWFLTPGEMEPADAESHYRERLWRLPGVGCCFEPPDGPLETPPELAAREPGRVEVGFVQSVAKNLPRHDRLLARIAAAAPAVRFHLTPSNNPRISARVRARVERHFDASGLEPARHLGIVRGLPRPQFLALGRALDFAIDSLGWSGGNTTLELLWGGLPVITCPGRTMRSRHTMAMLRLLDLPELIARDEDELVALAVRLAGSAEERADLRRRIEARRHHLYDDRRVIAALEDFIVGNVR
jgi:predicted O-linked N-acetylglucosamine transferase (SPINDLY family)